MGGWAFLAVLAGVFLLVVASVGPTLAGHRSLIVLGGSMEPAIQVGAMVVVDPVSPASLRARDVVTYVDRSNNVVTHRIIEVFQDQFGLGFRTQGDANDSPDFELVRPANVIGRVWYSVPYAGYLLHYGNQPAAKLAVLVAAFLMVIAPQLRKAVPAPAPDGPPAPAAPAPLAVGSAAAEQRRKSPE